MLTTPDRAHAPFDTALLDRLMDDAGMDILLVTSKHNAQYMLGGHRALFFDYMDAMGVSRYVPVFIYPKGAPDGIAYIGHRSETNQAEVAPFWVPTTETASWGSVDAIEKAVAHIHRRGLKTAHIGVESAFLPSDSAAALRRAIPNAEIIDALPTLERLRARKSPDELAMLREASERVIAAMESVITRHGPGTTKRELVEALRRAETDRGLTFEYCLIAAGTSFNRAPSDQKWEQGDVLSLDSGGNYHGYLGDIARMGILGEPDAELIDLLAMIEEIQQSAWHTLKPGQLGAEVYAGPTSLIAASPFREQLHFVGHGMGLVTHEMPHHTARGPVPYSDEDAHRPLESGMVLSIETTLRHPTRGFIKLEDTVAITDTGHEVFGNTLRGWTRGA